MPKVKSSKTILLLGAGWEQIAAIKLAKQMGLKVVVADGNPQAPGLKYADIKICADIKDPKKIIALGRQYKVDGIMVHAIEIPIVVAKAAKALGLPHLDPVVVDCATNKLKRATCFRKKGILYPRFASAKSFREAEAKSKTVGFPLVIKPIDRAGARGVKTINSLEELRLGMKESLSHSKHHTILMEEKLSGEEISTESVVLNGKIYTTGFGDRNYSRTEEFKPYFIEDGHRVGSRLPPAKQTAVIKAVENAIRALDISWGVAKGDILINRKGIYILEMAVRTSGGWFAGGTVPLATGVNILKPLLQMAVGLPVDERDFFPKFHRAACQRYVIPSQDGKFVRLEGVAKARRMPGVAMLNIFHRPLPGETVRKSKNNTERFGHLIAIGRDIDEATRRCEQAIRQIKIVIA